MSSKAALRVDAVSTPPPPPKARLRVVEGRAGKAPASRSGWVKPSAERQPDPLEEPVTGFCGLCGNKIEGQAVAEARTSGLNQRQQTWDYHDMCWRQLTRMRRVDEPEHALRKSVNPELRYSVRSDSRGSASLDSFSNLAG